MRAYDALHFFTRIDVEVGAECRMHCSHACCERVQAVFGHRFESVDCVKLCLVCSMRNVESLQDLAGFMFDSHTALVAVNNVDSLALQTCEWATMCSDVTSGEHDLSIDALADDARIFAELVTRLRSCLRCTLMETDPKSKFESAMVQTMCCFALHMRDSHMAIASVLGTLVLGDVRRIEALECEIDDYANVGGGMVTLSVFVDALAKLTAARYDR